jgi:glutamine cyclotransferase/predicted small secreted protein
MSNYRRRPGLVVMLILLPAVLIGACSNATGVGQEASVSAAQMAATAEMAAGAREAQSEAAAAAPLPPDAHQTQLVAPTLYTYRVRNIYPHDPTSFTQGLIVRDGQFLEGTGREGQSRLRRVEIETGKVLQEQALGDEYFGEGITELDGKIYQLTWRSGAGFLYDAESFQETGQFSYAGEGWGITHDGEKLIVSDGSATLQFWDPATMQQTGGVYVSLLGLPLSQLNELEYIDGSVFANVWQTNLLVRIDPLTGNVTGVVDLGGLLDYAPPAEGQPDVLNGIAYDAETGRLFVTGKLWPSVFEIELLEVKK